MLRHKNECCLYCNECNLGQLVHKQIIYMKVNQNGNTTDIQYQFIFKSVSQLLSFVQVGESIQNWCFFFLFFFVQQPDDVRKPLRLKSISKYPSPPPPLSQLPCLPFLQLGHLGKICKTTRYQRGGAETMYNKKKD